MDRDRSGKAGRPGHVRDPLPEVEGEHRVRDVADRSRRDGHGAVGQSPGRPEDRDGRQEALPRPGQRNPESVGLPVGPRTEDKKSDARTRGGRFNQPPRMRGPWRARGPRPRSSWSGTPGSGNGAWCIAPRFDPYADRYLDMLGAKVSKKEILLPVRLRDGTTLD